MRLPGMDGNAAIRALHQTCPQLRYLVYTGSANYAVPDELQRLIDREIPFLRKPIYDMNLLANWVRDLGAF
jgi:CheY-like chemotaxis protein